MVSILIGYGIVACYFDIKYREIPEGFWMLLYTIGIPVTALFYYIGIYPWEAGVISAFGVAVFLILLLRGVYEGADFVYLSAISLFFVTNPFSGHSLMIFSYGIFLVVSIIGCALAYQFIKLRYSMQNYPMMIPITIALILTVILG
jgi:hypothetical protein